MRNIKITETAARYGLSARAFELLLVEKGWLLDGQVAEIAVLKGYLTKERELGPRGQGFLDGYLGRRR